MPGPSVLFLRILGGRSNQLRPLGTLWGCSWGGLQFCAGEENGGQPCLSAKSLPGPAHGAPHPSSI